MASADVNRDVFGIKQSKDSGTKLECHFNWELDLIQKETNLVKFETELLDELVDKPFQNIQCNLLLGYISTLDRDTYDPKKVKGYFEKALEEAGSAEDKRFVAEANLLLFKKKSGENDEPIIENMHDLRIKWQIWEENEPHKTAFTYGCQAFVLSKFGPNYCEKALELYGKASDLDPSDWVWHFGKAVMLERKRKHSNQEVRPSEETLDLFTKVKKLSQPDIHIYVKVQHAACLTSLYRAYYKTKTRHHKDTEQEMDAKKNELKKQIGHLLQESCDEAFKTNNKSFLKRCMKCYNEMAWTKELTECCEKIEKNCSLKNDTGLLHRIAKCYMGTPLKDDRKAKEYLEKSLSNAPHGNIYAAIDYIKVRLFMKEDIDVDNEYQKLIKKYGDVRKDYAEIHSNWAISLKKQKALEETNMRTSKPRRFPDSNANQKINKNCLFHLKESVKHSSPDILCKHRSYIELERLCRETIESAMTRQQAYKNLAMVYFLPEPKTADNLKQAEKHLSCLKPDEFEQDDLELYGKVLYELKEYDRALEQFEKLEDSHEKKTYHLAKCFLCLGMQKVDEQDQLKNAVEFLLKSVQNGCLDGCDMLLDNMAEIPPKDHYHLCGYITLCLEDSHSFFIGKSKDRELIKRKMKKDILGITDIPKLENYKGLEGITKRIRHLQLVLNTDKLREFETDLLQTTKDLLAESRKLLDHLHHQLKQKLCPSSSGLVYFPHLSEGQISKTSNSPKPGSPEAKDLTRKKIEEKFNSDLRDKVKVDKCRDLIEFVASHQPYFDPDSYSWLYDAWEVVKMEKHQEYLVSIETKVPRRDETVNYVELAQQLAFYSEGMLEQYCKILLQE